MTSNDKRAPLSAHSRYRVHDSQRHVSQHMRRNTSINPRYLIVDKTSGVSVDGFTTADTAQTICTDMNRQHRDLLERARMIVDESGCELATAYERAEYELEHNLLYDALRSQR